MFAAISLGYGRGMFWSVPLMRQLYRLAAIFTLSVIAGCTKSGSEYPPPPDYSAAAYQPKFQRCAGSYEPEKCDAQELALSKETAAQAAARAQRLDEERTKSMELVNARPVSDAQETQPATATGWYTFDVNHVKCFPAPTSPADRIRMIQEAGFHAKTNDIAAGAVEVGQDTQRGFEYWTYFKTLESCVAALPRSKPIPLKYE